MSSQSRPTPILRVAFATCRAFPDVTADDRMLVGALEPRGIVVDAAPWDSSIEWRDYRVVLPRNTWDYHRRIREFEDWLERVDAAGVALVNPLSVLRWNLSKRYLEALAVRGVSIVPTVWVESAASPEVPRLAEIVTTRGWHSGMVIKPIVSASAAHTWISTTQTSEDEDRFRRSLVRSSAGLMVQPFLPEIRSGGEWSLIFLGGRYSHAALKRPADGDFRVQSEHGGSATAASPPATLIEDGARILEAAALSTGHEECEIAYARIDGVERNGRLLLMECELIEPALYLSMSSTAADDLAAGIRAASERAQSSRSLPRLRTS